MKTSAACLSFAVILLSLILHIEDTSLAHESRPVYVEIIETEPGVYSFTWKTPKSIPAFNIPKIYAPGSCEQIGTEFAGNLGDSFVREKVYRCEDGLTGASVEVSFPAHNPSVQTLIRLETHSGETHSALLEPGRTIWQVPESESKSRVAKDYTVLGITHILEGYDHLLFLVCLILIAGTGRRILITVTGFTLAHSLTLALSALNLLTLPVAPIEAVIALSIVFLASEIAKEPRDTLTYRYPILVSIAFGLLHGLGFASVLKQVGLPQTEIGTGLLFFNVGVEIGQLAFIAAAIVLYKIFMLITKGRVLNLMAFEKPAAYAVGSLASFWMIERIYSFWY